MQALACIYVLLVRAGMCMLSCDCQNAQAWACIYVIVNMFKDVHASMWLLVCASICMHLHIHVMCKHMHLCDGLYMQACACMCKCVQVCNHVWGSKVCWFVEAYHMNVHKYRRKIQREKTVQCGPITCCAEPAPPSFAQRHVVPCFAVLHHSMPESAIM
jgi:hypothetical protein